MVPVEQFLVLNFESHRSSTVRIYGAGIRSDRRSSIGTAGATFVTASAAAAAAAAAAATATAAANSSTSSFSRGSRGPTAGD